MNKEVKNSYQHKENVILTKSKTFAVDIVRLCQSLQGEKREFVLSKQVLRSGTSIGANAKEAINGASNKDFGNKRQLHLKKREKRNIGWKFFSKLAIYQLNDLII